MSSSFKVTSIGLPFTPQPRVEKPFSKDHPHQVALSDEAKKRRIRHVSSEGTFLEGIQDSRSQAAMKATQKFGGLALAYNRDWTIGYTGMRQVRVSEIRPRNSPIILLTRALAEFRFSIDEKAHLSQDAEGDDRYSIREILGSGTFATAFLADRKDKVGQRVVIKASHTFEPDELRTAASEAQLIRKLNANPYIPKLIEARPVKNILGYQNYIIVLEYLPLKTLIQFQKSSTLPFEQVSAFAWLMTDFLHKLHRSGTIHMDLKPENILLGVKSEPSTPEELAEMLQKLHIEESSLKESFTKELCKMTLKVIDFGGSMTTSKISRERYHITSWYRHPAIVGTFKFIPEFDYFSLGAILYELYTGRPLLGIGCKIIKAIEEANKKQRSEGHDRIYLHQLVRLRVAQAILEISTQEQLASMNDTLLAKYYERSPNGTYCLKPWPTENPYLIEVIESKLILEREEIEKRFDEAKAERGLSDDVHEAFQSLVFGVLLSGNQIAPKELKRHRFFQLVALEG